MYVSSDRARETGGRARAASPLAQQYRWGNVLSENITGPERPNEKKKKKKIYLPLFTIPAKISVSSNLRVKNTLGRRPTGRCKSRLKRPSNWELGKTYLRQGAEKDAVGCADPRRAEFHQKKRMSKHSKDGGNRSLESKRSNKRRSCVQCPNKYAGKIG